MSQEQVYKSEEAAKLHLAMKPQWPALLLIAVGVALLLANVFHFHLMTVLWPGFIIAPGLMLLWPAYAATAERDDVASFLAVPGAIVTMVGLMLFVMNLTHHFEAWAYSWPLLPAAAVGGLMYANRFDPAHRFHEIGRRLIRFMVIIFIALAFLFEVMIFGHLNPWLPLALIGYGVYLLLKSLRETG